ncbi:MAG: S-adenosylmethionine:tRNA ribosyltransferase-isomerase, partial [Janthinobacterium lividum]
MAAAEAGIETYDFALPQELIAQAPARPRDSARLLHVGAAGLADLGVAELPSLLRRGDILVANDTRVIPAQLEAWRGEARIGITLDQPAADGTWHVLVRNARRLRVGDVLRFAARGGGGEAAGGPGAKGAPAGGGEGAGGGTAGGLGAEVVALDGQGGATLRFDREGEAFDLALREAGALALPPYIARPDGPTEADAADYQTVFARSRGAVAAPTAGLHFTPALLAALEAAG